MIFVTVGTQKFQFNRLIDAVDKLATELVDEEFFVQTGFTETKPKHCRHEAFLDKDEFEKAIEDAKIVITHAGVGSVMKCLELNKRTIVVPRRACFGEHVDDHQLDLAEILSEQGYVNCAASLDDLTEIIGKIEVLTYRKYQKKEDCICRDIESHLKEWGCE